MFVGVFVGVVVIRAVIIVVVGVVLIVASMTSIMHIRLTSIMLSHIHIIPRLHVAHSNPCSPNSPCSLMSRAELMSSAHPDLAIKGVQWVESRNLWQVTHQGKYVGCCKALAEGDDAKRKAWDTAIAMKAKKLGISKQNLLKSLQASQSSQSS